MPARRRICLPVTSRIEAMYVPTLFAEDRPEEIQAIMRTCSLPVLVSLLKEDGAARMTATHLPLTLSIICERPLTTRIQAPAISIVSAISAV